MEPKEPPVSALPPPMSVPEPGPMGACAGAYFLRRSYMCDLFPAYVVTEYLRAYTTASLRFGRASSRFANSMSICFSA